MNEESTLKTAKILTANKLPDRFLETKIYEPTDPEESILGNTYILVEVTTPWFPTAKITKLIRNTFLEEYYHQSLNRLEVKRFEDGLKAVNKKLSDLAGAGQTEWIGNLNSVIAIISNNRLYLSHTGTAESYLFRHNKISHITSGEDLPKNPAPIQTFSALINGNLEQGDKLVFSNSEMYNFVSIDTLRNAVGQISPNGAVDEIAHILMREKAEKVNAIFVYLGADNKLNAQTAAAMPDTIFIDAPESSSSFLKFKPQNLLPTAKRALTSLGYLTLRTWNLTKSALKKKPKQEPEEIKKELNKSRPIKDLSYMTSSIDLNLSHKRDKSRKQEGGLAKFISIFGSLFSWIKGLNRKWLYGALALIIILSVAGGIYWRTRSQSSASSDLTAIVSAAQEKMNSADTQAALHLDNEARRLLLEARSMLLDIKDKPRSPVEVVILLEKLEQKLNQVNRVVLIDNPKELANLSSLGAGIEARNLIYLDGALYSLNTKGQELMVIIVDKGDKQVQTKLPADAGEVQNLASFNDDRVLAIETSKGKIFEFNLKTNKLEEKKNTQEIAYPAADSLGTYLTALYFLNRDDGVLKKFLPSGNDYDKGRDVFKPGVVNLKDVNSFALDGYIYLLHENGKLDRTLKGGLDANFNLKNIPEPQPSLEEPNLIITNADLTSLYILENKKHRILEFNKNGDYLRQFSFKDNLGEINNFAVNEKAKKLYLLANNRISEIDL